MKTQAVPNTSELADEVDWDADGAAVDPNEDALPGDWNHRASRTQRADHSEDSVIEVLSTPPAREGTHRSARFARLRTGMTVGEYLTEAHAAAPQRPRYKRHADVIRLESEGYIRVLPPSGASETEEKVPEMTA